MKDSDAFDPRTLAPDARRVLPDAPHVAAALDRATTGAWDGRAYWRLDTASETAAEHHRIDGTPFGTVVVDLNADGQLIGVEFLSRL